MLPLPSFNVIYTGITKRYSQYFNCFTTKKPPIKLLEGEGQSFLFTSFIQGKKKEIPLKLTFFSIIKGVERHEFDFFFFKSQ